MASSAHPELIQRLQQLQRAHLAQQLQQAAANHQAQAQAQAQANANANGTSTAGGRRAQLDPEARRRRRQQQQQQQKTSSIGGATGRKIDEAARLNRENRRGFKEWYRGYKQTLREDLARDCANMSAEAVRYGVSRPEWFIVASGGQQLRDFFSTLADAQKLALFDIAMARQADKGDISSDKVAVFNTVNGRPGDMPQGTA